MSRTNNFEIVDGINYKECSVCHNMIVANYDNFSRRKHGLFGLDSQCRKCKNLLKTIKRSNNPDYFRNREREIYSLNKDSITQRKREYYQNNSDKIKEKTKERYKKYYKENPERFISKYHNREALKNQSGSVSRSEWICILDFYQNSCLKCGKIGKVTMDHVVPLSIGGAHLPSNIQPLCGSCNSSKGTKIEDYREELIF